jgi:hypothetical protein
LELRNTEVTDAGLEYLKGFNQLEQLNLENTEVTDAGLKYLNGLIQLESLDVEGTPVTDFGVMRLQQVLPNCRVITAASRQIAPGSGRSP